MATTTQTVTKTKANASKLVCFSFAAYAKTVIDHLKSLEIPVLPGLTDDEFAAVELAFNFSFPPDLRSILQEGLPAGPQFPNWRSASPQQLQILLNLPLLNLSKNISKSNFWVDSWGPKPDDSNKALSSAKLFLDKAPTLVPIFRNCYIPSTRNVAGNPVFYVDDRHVCVLSFDVARFFQELEFLQLRLDVTEPVYWSRKEKLSVNVPAWASTAAKRVEFWSEAAERGRRMIAREPTVGWWTDKDCLRDHLEEVYWRLRDGGWREEEVREMMLMDGSDYAIENSCCSTKFNEEHVTWHVRALLRAGWSREDVVYSLDLQEFENGSGPITKLLEGKLASETHSHISITCSREDHNSQNILIKPVQSLEV
ncbi:hypothetical protein K2173_014766 [Erythroxylum novogranatense]|uniref:Uncharacterized protein n=1 Tax=Erythroxylum novogranatense TaxID=1862640 RepID=A0AAV8TI26_9ROSI|nr:hypothetical protein K2173_014766 [Erythroxylum novogranatense]